MSNKDLRFLKRSELIEIIYQLKKNEDELIKENEQLKKKLLEREIKIEKAGSIAEASLAISGIFSAAEEAVSLYVEEIERRYKKLKEEETQKKEGNVSNSKKSTASKRKKK